LTVDTRRRFRGGVLAAALALVLAGCALQRPVPGTSIAWAERRSALLDLEDWELSGRIGVKSGDEGGQGRLEWRQAGDAARLRVSGPFGAGAWELRWDPREAVLSNGDGEIALAYAGSDALDRMLAEQVGWQFPAAQTRYWVLGIAAPGSRSRLLYGPDGWLEGLEQDGWTVGYAGFAERGGYWMPRKITVQGSDARLRLVVDRWRPAGPD
jgi:outer membrane lipoprotein LolB